MVKSIINLSDIKSISELVAKSKWLEGKTLGEVTEVIRKLDSTSRVITKGEVGYVIEKGFFGIEKNSDSKPDILHLGVEVKTCSLKHRKDGSLNVKEPLSLGIINYNEEYKNEDITNSTLYKKNRNLLLVCYVHDKHNPRSSYLIKYVFMLELNNQILNEIRPDYNLIIEKINQGKAHEIHQPQHKCLTLCPKHSGVFKDPENPRYARSRRTQPFSKDFAEIKAFRFKNRYMNFIITRCLDKKLEKNGWKDD